MTTFGVELELITPNAMSHADLAAALTAAGISAQSQLYNHRTSSQWKVVSDASIAGHGAELVSPVLEGDEGLLQVRLACEAAVEAGCSVNRSCGFHVHVGVGEANLGFFKRLVALYEKYEPVLDTLVSPSRRGSGNSYCRPVAMYKAVVDRASRLDQLRSVNRFHKLNLAAYWRHGTVEFRAHQGTLDGDKVVAWAQLCLGLVAEAKRTAPTVAVERSGGLVRHYFWGRGRQTRARVMTVYREGMSQGEALAALVGHVPARRERAYLDWDVSRGLVSFEPVHEAVAERPAAEAVVEHPATLEGLFETARLSVEHRTFFTNRQRQLAAADQRRRA